MAANDIVFVFNGIGPQWPGMASNSANQNKFFDLQLQYFDELFATISTERIYDVLTSTQQQSEILTSHAIVSNFVLQASIVKALEEHNIIPKAVVGHSIGEFSAALCAGGLDATSALKVVNASALLHQRFHKTGTMLSVNLSDKTACDYIQRHSLTDIKIAADNGPYSVTLSGLEDRLDALSEILLDDDVFHVFLNTSVAFHHPSLTSIIQEFKPLLQDLYVTRPSIPIFSTVTGARYNVEMQQEYWSQNLLMPVQFHKAITSLLEEGYRTFVHIGSHPELRYFIDEICHLINIDDCIQISTLSRSETNINQAISHLTNRLI